MYHSIQDSQVRKKNIDIRKDKIKNLNSYFL